MSPLARKRAATSWIGVRGDASARGFDRVDGGLRWQHREHVEGREDPALVGPIGVDVDDERWESGLAAALGDGGDDRGDAAGVVPVPVRQEQHLDAGQVDGQPLGVGEPDVAVGADIEQHRRRAIPLSGGREGREPMTGHAELVEAHDAVVPLVLAAGRHTPEQVGQLRQLRDAWADARERVGRVVDDDGDGELVHLGKNRARVGCHRSIVAPLR